MPQPPPQTTAADIIAEARRRTAFFRFTPSLLEGLPVEKWGWEAIAHSLAAEVERLRPKAEAYDRINTPEVTLFLSDVHNEALHQRERWGVDADGGKTDAEWYWLVGHLAGKALHDVKGKRLHHIITSAAALLNWHAHAMGAYARMRPGIAEPAEVTASTNDADALLRHTDGVRRRLMERAP